MFNLRNQNNPKMTFDISKLRRWSLPLMTMVMFTTCELPVDWELKPGENGKLVIEAIITNEQKAQEVKLSLSYNDFNEKPVPVSEAVVRFYDGQNVVEFVEDSMEPGTFRSVVPIVLTYFTDYSLEVFYKGEQHMATSYMVPVLPFQPLTFQQIGETDSLRIKEVANIYGLVQQAMYEIDINWSHITNADSSKAKVFYYTFTTVDAGQIFSPPKEDVIFPRGSIVVEKNIPLMKILPNLCVPWFWKLNGRVVFTRMIPEVCPLISAMGLWAFSVFVP